MDSSKAFETLKIWPILWFNSFMKELKTSQAVLPSKFGDFVVTCYRAPKGFETLVLTTQDFDATKSPLIRIHSECMTGDVFGSLRCDCGPQRDEAMSRISKEGNGMFIYLRQEGRGMGLFSKVRAYSLMEKGVDTHEACVQLGHQPDERDYGLAVKILGDFGVKSLRLLTNNPSKVSPIFRAGFHVERVPLLIEPNKHNQGYFDTKKCKFNHLFEQDDSLYNFCGFTFTNPNTDINNLVERLCGLRLSTKTMIHVGVYVDESYLENKYLQDHIKKIYEVCLLNPKCIPVIHLTIENSKHPFALISGVKEVFSYIDAIQITHIGDGLVDIVKLATRHFKTVIVPLDEDNLEIVRSKDFQDVFNRFKPFILLDNSKGGGIQETKETLKNKIQTCLDNGINRIGLAGGFGPSTLENYFAMRDYFKIDFSIDAESNLHTNNMLDEEKVVSYLRRLGN